MDVLFCRRGAIAGDDATTIDDDDATIAERQERGVCVNERATRCEDRARQRVFLARRPTVSTERPRTLCRGVKSSIQLNPAQSSAQRQTRADLLLN
jgi:hypothetical protein